MEILIVLSILLIIKWVIERRSKCKHTWITINTSNALQLDHMGYPLMLCIVRCDRCGKIEHQWIDVDTEVLSGLDTGRFVKVEWRTRNFD